MIILFLFILFLFSLIFGLFCLILSLGYPNWYKNKWKKDFKNEPQDLLIKTTTIGAICTAIGFMILLIIILFFDKIDKNKSNYPFKHKT